MRGFDIARRWRSSLLNHRGPALARDTSADSAYRVFSTRSALAQPLVVEQGRSPGVETR
ncbi:hypothetical protein [Nocardioides dongkuii]|uniref:hypothetical protein n=1 Tax=Nocardioides dongkuii TaxID=2760089 RepID=UPI00187783B4|nr:hypothetical protein [Nocardioides dongkuii]